MRGEGAPSPGARASRSPAAVADALGHCLFVFTFVPLLTSIPSWIWFEATNRLNAHDPVVLAFVPARGLFLLLDTFEDGAVQGILAGAIYGALLSLWTSWRGRDASARQRIVVGALLGAIAAGLALLVFHAGTLRTGTAARGGPGQLTALAGLRPLRTPTFELVAGIVCGMIAASTAVRLARGEIRDTTRTSRSAPILHALWAVTCVTAVVLLVGIRWLRYTSWSAYPPLDHVLRELMVLDEQTFLYPWAWSMLKVRTIFLACGLAVVALHRRVLDRLVRRADGRWRLTPLAVSLSLGAMVWLHYLFDLDPAVAAVCAASLALAWLAGRARVAAGLPSGVWMVVWGALFAGALVAAGDVADRAGIAAWGLFLLGTHRWLAPRTGGAELVLARLVGVMGANLVPPMLPLLLPLHGGTLLGAGFAYGFCEVPDRKILYAGMPACDTPLTDYDACRHGKLVEYDLTSMKEVAAHEFFSPDFFGRLELLACLDDEVQVAVQSLVYHGRDVVQGVLSFPVADPDHFTVLTAEKGIGTEIAWDREHDAVFYSGEFDNPLVRYDRRTRTFDDTPGRALVRPWFEPMSLRANTASLTVSTDGIHPRRNRLYVGEWLQGRYAYAVDLTSLDVTARYDVGGGGAMAISVDPDRDRLFVSSMWGLEVFDLATDTLIARKRTGPGNRPVVVDAARNRLYVSSMVEGKIRILDRDTLAVVGQIPVGFGTRYLHLSRDGRFLFASSKVAHYYWDADRLVARGPR